jgi:RNA polymerase sigma factor (sigma-70 family)
MDVGGGDSQGKLPKTAPSSPPRDGGELTRDEIAQVLGDVRERELRLARSFWECRQLSKEQREDLYHDVVIALLDRPYNDEKHLRSELRLAIKRRALNRRRDEGKRAEILANNAPAIHALQAARAADEGPEEQLMARQDWLVVAEFMADLTAVERPVFRLVSEGMKYNRIAKLRGIEVNEARSIISAVERKRERFQILYERGRLCGYRAATIRQLLDGGERSEQLVQQAATHLQACPQCQAEFQTNAQRLRAAFEEKAAALLPPVLTTRLGRGTRIGVHVRMLALRMRPDWVSIGQGGVRERAVALVAGGGASAKLVAGIATVAVIAGSTITATHALEHQHPHAHHRATAAVRRTVPAVRVADSAQLSSLAPASTSPRVPHSAPARHMLSPGHVVAHDVASSSSAARREPGGFAYLGIPTHTASATPAQPVAQTAQTAAHTGGPFSP